MAVLKKWKKLADQLLSIQTLKKDRITPIKLLNAFKAKRAFIMELGFNDEETIHIFGALWPTKNTNWLEIGTIYVAETHQGRGYSNQVVVELAKMAHDLGKSVFLISKEPPIQRVAEKSGLIRAKSVQNCPCFKAIGKKRDLGGGRMVFYHEHTQ